MLRNLFHTNGNKMKKPVLKQTVSSLIYEFNEKYLILKLYEKIQKCEDKELVKKWKENIPNSSIDAIRMSIVSAVDISHMNSYVLDSVLESDSLEHVVKFMENDESDINRIINHSIRSISVCQRGNSVYKYDWDVWKKFIDNTIPLIAFLINGKERDKTKDESAFKFLRILITSCI